MGKYGNITLYYDVLWEFDSDRMSVMGIAPYYDALWEL